MENAMDEKKGLKFYIKLCQEQGKKMERLEKEKEWLLCHFAEMLCQALRIANDKAIEEKKRVIIKDMQQALKVKIKHDVIDRSHYGVIKKINKR